MRTSRFTKDQKLEILMEQNSQNIAVEAICAKYGISIGTFYNWKREFTHRAEEEIYTHNTQSLKLENNTLRRLYIELSEHNYQLAQFLDK